MGSPEVSYDTPISWRNWFTLRCVFKRCEFRADALGAHCTTDKCTARVQIYFNQADQWNAMVKRDELATQDEFETISKRLVNKET